MAVSISRLRWWFAAAAIFVSLAVLGAYLYGRHRVQNALQQVPEKIGFNIQQSAQGFTISKSEQGRTLFKVQASRAIQFKQGGKVNLHDVTITLYGRDSSRFDQVYGQDFEYDQPSGDVASKGEVSIDLESNPAGVSHPDQSAPRELKDPIHLKTSGLVFNVKTGDATTDSAVEFRVPQASGSAVGAKYVAKDTALTLESQVKIAVNGTPPSTIIADRAVLEKAPRQIVLLHAHGESIDKQAQADTLTLFIGPDNTLERALGTGDVRIETRGPQPATVWAQRLEMFIKQRQGVDHALLSGDVRMKTAGPQENEASAGQALLSFGPRNALSKVHAEQQVKLVQHQKGSGPAQDTEITAPIMDFFVADNRLTRAETTGPPQVSLIPKEGGGSTRITADQFTAKFDDLGQLSSVYGPRNARVLSVPPLQDHSAQTERVSTSDSIEASFASGAGLQTIVQQGHFTYVAGTQKAFADRARYTAADQIITLSGSPRITDSGMITTARGVRLNRSTGEGFAQGDVKTTYNDLKPQPGGALLASSDPVHVTAQAMAAHNGPTTATYTGSARLWQNANVVEAPSIEFQKDQRKIIAESNSTQRVSTVLIGPDKAGKATPVNVTADHLIYTDSERKAHFESRVMVSGSDMTITSKQMDVYLVPAETRGQATVSASNSAQSKLEKIIASGSVVISEPNRRGTGEQLTYTAADDKFVLTGGPPSIFDAEHGKITGVSLTLFRRDGRVIVEGDSRSPAVTETRVVR